MAALATELTNRYSTQYLANLTNPDTKAVTINPVTRDAAIADVGAEFESVTGVVINTDETKPEGRIHILVALEGVIVYLLMRTGQGEEALEARYARWQERLRGLRGRLIPKTNSVLTVTKQSRQDRPTFDDSRFGGIIPNKPGL